MDDNRKYGRQDHKRKSINLSRKTILYLVENILALAAMIIFTLVAVFQLELLVITETDNWRAYTFFIVSGILCLVIGVVIGKNLLIFIFKLIRGEPPKGKVEG